MALAEMTREQLEQANQALLAKRKELGITTTKTKPIGGRLSLLSGTTEAEKLYFADVFNRDIQQANDRGIGGNLDRWRNFDSDRQPDLIKAVKTIKKWYEHRLNDGGGLILAGGYGAGKTELARAIKEAFGYGAIFWNEEKLVEAIQGGYGHKNGRSQESIMIECWRSPLLILDDLGGYTTENTPWVQNIYYSLFDGRHEAGKAFIITTNLSYKPSQQGNIMYPSEFQERVGNRNFSRIMGAVDTGEYCIDLFNVPDYRLRNLKK